MNRAWGTLGAVAAATVSGIYFVHWRQQTERDRMHTGVLRDIEEERQQQLTAAALSQPVPTDSASRAWHSEVQPKIAKALTKAKDYAGAIARADACLAMLGDGGGRWSVGCPSNVPILPS